MRSSTMTLALLASVSVPALAAPISRIQARSDLEARLSLGAAAKAVGGGIATGGLFAGLTGLLGKITGGGEPAPARRSLDTRQIVKLATKLFGVADDLPIGKALAQGAAGGVVGGTAIAATNGLFDGVKSLFSRELDVELTDDEAAVYQLIAGLKNVQKVEPEKRDLETRALLGSLFSGAAKTGGGKVAGEAVKTGLGSILGGAALGGIGSAIGGTAIGQLFARDAQLTDDEATLLAIMVAAEQQNSASSTEKRSVLGSLFSGAAKTGGGKVAGEAVKTGLGTILGGAALGGIGSAIGGTAIGQFFSRDVEDLTDDETALLAMIMAAEQQETKSVEARAFKIPSSALKSIAGTITGLGATILSQGVIDSFLGSKDAAPAVRRALADLSDEDLAQLNSLINPTAAASINDLD